MNSQQQNDSILDITQTLSTGQAELRDRIIKLEENHLEWDHPALNVGQNLD